MASLRIAVQDAGTDALAAPLLAVPVYADDGARGAAFDEVDGLWKGRLSTLADEEGLDGKPGKHLLIHAAGDHAIARVLLVGMGKAGEVGPKDLRGLAAAAVQEANTRKLGAVACHLGGSSDAATLRFALEGALLGGYRYTAFRTKDVDPLTCEAFTFVGAACTEADEIVRRMQATCVGVALARDLVNGPPNEVTPTRLADVAEQIAKDEGLEIEVFDEAGIEALGMNLLLAVNAASAEEPRFIRLTYRPAGAGADTPQIALIGKGLTFDAGGYNLKPTGSIEDMKLDMAGAAAVLGAMKAIQAYAPKMIVHGLVASAENMISGAGYRPGDIIRSLNGKTVEIGNTDAEGRLVLADALTYAERELKVDRMVNLATLTGACVVALGPHTSAIFSNDDAFGAEVKAAADAAGEDMWPLPLNKKLRSMLKSPVADMKNVGERWGGAITAALFLEEFAGETKWVHLDIAGPSFSEKPDGHITKGGTGVGVTTLLTVVSEA